MTIASRYEVVRLLDPSPIGWRMLALDSALDETPVVLTVIYPHHSADPAVIERVQRELLTVRRLVHPNICQVFDFDFSANGSRFFCSEYLRGATLRELMSEPREPLDERQIIALLAPIAEALDYSHRNGAVHGGIAPETCFVSDAGVVKVMDFGLSRALAESDGLTRTGETAFVPEYMAPEQLVGGEPDPRSDIYSFGCIAYELFTGKPPFRHESYLRLNELHRTGAVIDSMLHTNASPWLADIILRAISPSPDDRPAAKDLASILCDRAPRGSDLTAALRALRPKNTVRRRVAFGLTLYVLGNLALMWLFDQNGWRYWPVRSVLALERYLDTVGLPAAIAVPLRFLTSTEVSIVDPSRNYRLDYYNRSRNMDCLALMDAGLRPELPPAKGGHSFLHWLAAQPGQHDCLHNILLRAPLLVHVSDARGDSPLHIAVRSGNRASAEKLLLFGADASARNVDGVSPIDLALERGDTALLQSFAAHGSPKHWTRPTILSRAITSRSLPAIRAGFGDKNAFRPDWTGETPLMRAARLGIELPSEDMEVFFEHKTMLALRDAEGYTALAHAIRGGSAAWVKALLENGSALHVYDGAGRTPLILAIAHNEPAIVEILLKHGANPNQRAVGGLTPLDVAERRNAEDIKALLISYGATARRADLCHSEK